jgi:large subunit ribosomal protein L4
MLDVPVYDTEGKLIETLKVDEAIFGGTVNVDLVKQAMVTYHANRRQGTASNLNRHLVAGTTAKAYRQKGTGRARRGDMKTNIIRGGGVAHRKYARDFRQTFPRKMRRAALRSAILAKMLASDLMVLDGLAMTAPATKRMATVMKNLKVNRTCLLTLAGRDANIYLSCRNLPDMTVRIAAELNAFDVMTRRKMVVTREAMKALVGQEAQS